MGKSECTSTSKSIGRNRNDRLALQAVQNGYLSSHLTQYRAEGLKCNCYGVYGTINLKYHPSLISFSLKIILPFEGMNLQLNLCKECSLYFGKRCK